MIIPIYRIQRSHLHLLSLAASVRQSQPAELAWNPNRPARYYHRSSINRNICGKSSTHPLSKPPPSNLIARSLIYIQINYSIRRHDHRNPTFNVPLSIDHQFISPLNAFPFALPSTLSTGAPHPARRGTPSKRRPLETAGHCQRGIHTGAAQRWLGQQPRVPVSQPMERNSSVQRAHAHRAHCHVQHNLREY